MMTPQNQNINFDTCTIAPQINHLKALFYYFQNLKKELKLKPFLHQKYRCQQNCRNLGTNWNIFSKALMMHYHCTKFHVFSISLSIDVTHWQKGPPVHTWILKNPNVIGLTIDLCFITFILKFLCSRT